MPTSSTYWKKKERRETMNSYIDAQCRNMIAMVSTFEQACTMAAMKDNGKRNYLKSHDNITPSVSDWRGTFLEIKRRLPVGMEIK